VHPAATASVDADVAIVLDHLARAMGLSAAAP
jgi:hypothetical protein